MNAIVRHDYGLPDAALVLGEVDRPSLTDDGVLVRVRAASVNPVDWHTVTGNPYVMRMSAGLRRPKLEAIGTDFAGTVEAVGSDVKQFQPGDDVFGVRIGAFAEYVCVSEDRAVAPKPANLTFEQAAAVPVAAITALQGLRDKGRIQAGHRVLINGASGGVGTFAVQIAKSFGAEVTGVCSTRNVDLVRSLGADHVVDYTLEDFTRSGQRYDLMLDMAGNRSWSDCVRVLDAKAIVVVVGGPKANRWIGPLAHVAGVRLASMRTSQKMTFFLADVNKADLLVLTELLEAGTVTPVVDAQYDGLDRVPEALGYLGEGHARGKIVVTV
jgi:NADPH:quinone reductase-like Zn-dependent oxidoreductase